MLDKLYIQVPTSFKIATAKNRVSHSDTGVYSLLMFNLLFGARPQGPFVIGVLGKA